MLKSKEVMAQPLEFFREAMRVRGIIPPVNIIADGKIHRADVEGPRGKGDASYLLHLDVLPAGGFENFRDGKCWETWRADTGHKFTEEEEAEHRERLKKHRREREAEEAKRHEEARRRAEEIFNAAKPATNEHPYLKRKGVLAYPGLQVGGWPQRGKENCLLVPMRDTEGRLWNIEGVFPAIDHSLGRDKDFLYGGRKQGLYFSIGGKPNGVLCITEGLATGLTIHEASGYFVAVAFDAGNLSSVAHVLQGRFPDVEIVICGDDDKWTQGNPGLTKAKQAAGAVGGRVAFPSFKPEHLGEKPTDFNDLANLEGREVVEAQIERALAEVEPTPAAEVGPAEKNRCTPKEQANKQGLSDLFPEIEDWPNPVDGTALLDELSATFERYCILPEHGAATAALWCLFTWCLSSFQVAPLLLITSPELRCGKSTLLSILGRLVYRALSCSNVSASALFRSIEKWTPTLLIDEADSFMCENEELRGILNSGHSLENAYVLRVEGEGKKREPQRFFTWSAKALAMIGEPAGTIIDRSIKLKLRRKLKTEQVERLRHVDPAIFETLRRKCKRWVADHSKELTAARPEVPESLNDRTSDNWEGLLAIAEVAGGDWPANARAAALGLSGILELDESNSLRVQLLADIKEYFENMKEERVKTADLLAYLNKQEERKWSEWNKGKNMNPEQLSRLLKPFGIKTSKIRFDIETARGFHLSDFKDTFERFLPETPPQNFTPPNVPPLNLEQVEQPIESNRYEEKTKTPLLQKSEANPLNLNVVPCVPGSSPEHGGREGTSPVSVRHFISPGNRDNGKFSAPEIIKMRLEIRDLDKSEIATLIKKCPPEDVHRLELLNYVFFERYKITPF